MAIPSRRLHLGPASGRLLLRTRRQGFAARVGHDLTIEVADWTAQVDLPDDLSQVRITARISLDSLAVIEGTGGTMPLSDADRRQIAQNARQALAVDRYPTATFESDRAEPAGGGGGTIGGILRLHGASAPVRLEVHMDGDQRYRASTEVTQTEYGIKPYSAFFGSLKLRDQVEVECVVDLAAAEPIES